MIKNTLYILLAMLGTCMIAYDREYTDFQYFVTYAFFWIGLNVQDIARSLSK